VMFSVWRQVLVYLVEHGAPLEDLDREQQSVLHYSASYG
jgi:hypothetical protein